MSFFFHFCCIVDNMGEGSLSWCCMCVIRSMLRHHSTLGGGVPFFWLCVLRLWISPRPTPHWHSDKSLISRLVLLLDIAGRSDDGSSAWSTEIWCRKSLVLFECKVISISAPNSWLRPACVSVRVWCLCVLMFFCVGVSAFVGEGRGRRTEWVRGERSAVCVGGTWGSGVKNHYTNKAAGDEILKDFKDTLS